MSLESISSAVIESISTWIKNLAYLLLTPIINIIFTLIPDFTKYVNILSQFFTILATYLNYILDMTLIYNPVLIYLVGSIIFRITSKLQVYIGKLIIKWWEALV